MFRPTLKKFLLPGMGTRRNSIYVVFEHEVYIKDENMNRGEAKRSYTNVHSCTCICRSSHPDVFCEKSSFRSFTKCTGKLLCQSLFFNKNADLRPATLLKNRLWHRCFPVNFAKFLRRPFITEHLWWLLLHVSFCKL